MKKASLAAAALITSSFSLSAETYEIVSFKYKGDVPFEVQQQSTESLNEVVSSFEGFQSRQFFYSDENHRWFDLVVWDSIEDAKLATEKAMADPRALKVFALMDENSALFAHYKKISADRCSYSIEQNLLF